MIRYASVCSGVGTCALAWRPLGWSTAWFSEIAAAPSAILAHRFPEVPNRGDMLDILERAIAAEHVDVAHPEDFDIDLLAGGTPCQSFSFAGLRRSLEDDRGNLSLAFCRLVHAIDAVRSARGHGGGLPFVIWENVPGVLSTKDNAFGCFLAGLVGTDQPVLPDGGWKRAGLVVGPRRAAVYRVLDAQYFGVAQRRQRVVVVSCSRASGYDPASLLLEWEGVRRDSPPCRGPGTETAGALTAGAGSRLDDQDVGGGHVVAHCLTAQTGDHSPDADRETLLPVSVAMGSDPITAHGVMQPITCRHGDPGVVGQPIPILDPTQRVGRSIEDVGIGIGIGIGIEGDPSYTLKAGAPQGIAQPLPFDTTNITSRENRANPGHGDPCHPLAAHAHAHAPAIAVAEARMLVRRLMPIECERLQGYPDGWTGIPRGKAGKVMKDGPRYKAIGNGWARPVFEWVGRRIDAAVKA